MKTISNSAILVVGMGEVGGPLHAILSSRNPDVIGIDIDPVSVAQPVGIMHVCFPFKNAERFEAEVVRYAHMYVPEIVVIDSTVIPGTTRSIENRIGIPAVSSPIRGKHTRMVHDLQAYVKFVAGANPEATLRVKEHFIAAGLKSEVLSTPEALELAKLLETTYFGLLIAWAQEMNRFADAAGADYLEVGKFFGEISYLPSVLFQPGHIGGHCVMPNIDLLQKRYRSEFFEAIKNSNEARKSELSLEGEIGSSERLKPLALA